MIFKNLSRRFMRSILTLLGISIGVAAIVALQAMANGMSQNYGSVVGGGSNDLLITQADAFDPILSKLDENLAQRLETIPGVENVEPGIYTWVTTEDLPFFIVFGYDVDSVAVRHYRVTEGKPVTGSGQLLIGQRAAESLSLGINDTLRVYGEPYRIVGIYETGQGMEESGGVVTLEDAKEIAKLEREVNLFQIGLRRNADIDTVLERIDALDEDLAASSSSDRDSNEQMDAVLNGYVWGIGTIAILIGGLGMMNAMVMSVMERTREIGTLRAVGWSRWRVLRLILGESMLLSFVGGLIGVTMGIGLAELAAMIPGFGAMLESNYSASVFMQGMMVALVLGLVGGLYPAWKASNLQPVEALRYEGGGATDAKQNFLSRIGNQSFRNLWRRRNRTLVAATSIGIGVATLVMLGGITTGMIGQLNTLAGSGGAGNITVMQKDVPDMSLSSLDERVARQIQAMSEVKSVSPTVMGFVMTEEMPLFIIMGLDPNSEAMDHYKLKQGRYVQRPSEIIIGSNAVESYNVGIGDTLTLFSTRYKIVGIYETGVAWEEGGGVMAMREAQRLLNRPRTVSFMFVDVVNPEQAETVSATIENRFPDAKASISSEFAQNTNDIANMQGFAAGIGFLAMLVGGIVVANTMIMAIYERTREIGTLRAVGWASRRILSQVVQESLMLCLLAAGLGSLLGVIVLTGLAQIPAVGTFLKPAWETTTFVNAVGSVLFLGILGGIYPAWRASRLKPVEALRYE
ncbi:MAG: ABC transporter permease [Chloroflexota bacterium]